MPVHIETTARIAVVYGHYDGSERYRAPVTVLEETTREGVVRFEAVRPPLGGGGHIALSDLHQGTGYRYEIIERTPDGMVHLTAYPPSSPSSGDRAPMYGGRDENGL